MRAALLLLVAWGCTSAAEPLGAPDAVTPCGACAPGFACREGDPATEAAPAVCRSDATGEVLVPAGWFWMGCAGTVTESGRAAAEPCHDDEYPAHPVHLETYAIDRTEVTARAYDACVAAGACVAPAVRGGGLPTSGAPAQADHPINFVTRLEAATYCAWPGKPAGPQRLCTEAEWEKAARGGCDQLGCVDEACCRERSGAYPWGHRADAVEARAVVDTGETRPVAQRPDGASPYGVLDMAGNVEEWVSDPYAGDVYCRGDAATCAEPCDRCVDAAPAARQDPDGPPGDWPMGVLRGGGFDSGVAGGFQGEPMWQAVRVSRRNPHPPDVIGSRIGFRCCRTVPSGD